MDWRRRKWGRVARTFLERSSLLAIRASGACITDSREVAHWYVQRYSREPHYIAHGVDMREIAGRGALKTYGLDERGYVLFVGRITPEKGVHHLIEAYKGLDTEKALVIVGDGSADPEYWKSLHLRAEGYRNVRLLGPVYGEPVRELFAHAYVYVQPSEIEGTALSLVEAMGYGNCVLVSDIAENVETVGHAGLTFDIRRPVESLRERLSELIAQPELVARQRAKSLDYARENFSWERVTDAHERLYYQVARVG
jgi:glycosyltransferase involved in cell wall biosynthesis